MTNSTGRRAARAAFYAVTAAALLGLASTGAHAETSAQANESRTTVLTLTATGEVKAAPDVISLNFGVSTNADSAAEAIRLNREQMTAVMASLKAQGVADTDIITSGIALNARYVVVKGASTTQGYTALNSVTVRYSDVSKAGAGIDAVVKAGVNQIRGLSFGLKNNEQYVSQASEQAIKNLMTKADLYARATGKTVKRLSVLTDGTTISSDDTQVIVTGYRAAPMSMPAMSISGGESVVRVSVSGQFEIQ